LEKFEAGKVPQGRLKNNRHFRDLLFQVTALTICIRAQFYRQNHPAFRPGGTPFFFLSEPIVLVPQPGL
jgi:hypothetical protein